MSCLALLKAFYINFIHLRAENLFFFFTTKNSIILNFCNPSALTMPMLYWRCRFRVVGNSTAATGDKTILADQLTAFIQRQHSNRVRWYRTSTHGLRSMQGPGQRLKNDIPEKPGHFQKHRTHSKRTRARQTSLNKVPLVSYLYPSCRPKQPKYRGPHSVPLISKATLRGRAKML